MNANSNAKRTMYLNALPILLESLIPVIEITVNKESYIKSVKKWLMNAKDISYWTPRPKYGDSDYTSYVTVINSGLDHAKQRLKELIDVVKINKEKTLEIERSCKIIEQAIMKRFIAQGWKCPIKHNINNSCYYGEPLKSKYLFKFYKSVEFRVMYLKDRNTLLLVLLPRIYVQGPTLKEILEKSGKESLNKLINSECSAMYNIERKYRKAILQAIKKINDDKYLANVVFYDGTSVDLELDKVRLIGNVLYYKSFITDLYDQETYEDLVKLHREYSFSLGPKESSFKIALEFKDLILEIVRSSQVFPFKLGGVKVDVDTNLFEISSGDNV